MDASHSVFSTVNRDDREPFRIGFVEIRGFSQGIRASTRKIENSSIKCAIMNISPSQATSFSCTVKTATG